MTTNYTTSLRLAEPTPGDPAVRNAWGTILNENMVLVEAAILGTSVVNIAGLIAYTLTTANGQVDQARPLVQSYTGALTGECTVTLPNVPKVGYAQNMTTGGFNVVLTAGAGMNATIPADGNWYLFFADGAANIMLVPLGFGTFNSLTISGLLTAGSADVSGIVTAGEVSSQGNASFGSVQAGSLSITSKVGIFAAPGNNTGNGTIGSTGALTGVRLGAYVITMGSATAFTVTDPLSVAVGSGVVGTPFTTQIEFTLIAGSVAFVSGDTFDLTIQAASTVGVGTAHSGNHGNGAIGGISLLSGYRIGTYVATFSSATAFIVDDPLGNTLGSGSTGTPFATQIGFTITVGATAFVAGDIFDIAVEPSTQIVGHLLIDGDIFGTGGLTIDGGISAESLTLTTGLPPGVQFGDMKHSSLGIEGAGWRLCYGQARSQTDPFWQFMINNGLTGSWLPGFTGSSTYNMPDARDLVLAGLDNMGGISRGLMPQGTTGFNPAILLNAGGNASLQSHAHTVFDTGHNHGDAGHFHGINDPGHAHGSPNGASFVTSAAQNVILSGGGGYGQLVNTTGVSGTSVSVQEGAANIQPSSANIVSEAAGSGASQNVQPTMMAAVLMYVGA